jgi:PAS domain S-box-containing protein
MTSASQEPRPVLVVDDEKVLRMMLTEALKAEGYSPVVARNADEAMERLAEHSFGVAIVDKNMPGDKSGLDVVRHASQVQPHLKSILFTGFPSIESTIEAFRAGAFDYVAKPVNNTLLMAQVRRAWQAYEDSSERDELFRKYESLFEIVPGIVWFMTESGVIRRINNEGAGLLGYQPKDLLGKPYSILLTPDESAPAAHWAFKERRTGKRATRGQVVSLRTKPGETRLFEVSATGAWDRSMDNPSKKLWGTLGVGWDITEHAALEEQLEQARRMEAIGRLAGGVAHDFNNILAVVMHSAEHFLESLSDLHPLREDAQALEEVARRGLSLTRQLLTVSRRGPVELETVGLSTVLTRFRPLLERLIPENIEIDIDCPEDLPLVRVDATQLEQLLVNLAVNARDAMADGGRLSITCRTVDVEAELAGTDSGMEDGRYVLLAVSDTGHGIPAEVQEHMFEPFFTTREEIGAGLGLATVYGIVRQADGYISVQSEVGIGTSMKVYLPARTDTTETLDRLLEVNSDAAGRNEVTLVAEDDSLVRRHISQALRRMGYSVLEASDGARALEVAEDREIELLVTDIIMPRVNGPELARQLRARYPNMRIIYMSGYVGNVLDSQELLQHGAVFMQKPFTPREMALTARRILDEPMD